MRGATIVSPPFLLHCINFNPRSSCEERLDLTAYQDVAEVFQSTLLMRGATRRKPRDAKAQGNFNPRSSCEERPHPIFLCMRFIGDFNPRSSCEERRRPRSRSECHRKHFNPRSSCEERPPPYGTPSPPAYFNPRSSCEERLLTPPSIPTQRHRFQSTLLMRGATGPESMKGGADMISIHAPHARSDARLKETLEQLTEISIHAPHARSDTTQTRVSKCGLAISIHAPHARSDMHRPSSSYFAIDFNPRSSCEERLAASVWN